jgi:protein TonB
MFEDTLIESTSRIRTHRGWTTIVSFVIQGIAIVVVVLIPLIYTQALPTRALTTMLVAPPPPPPPPPPPAASKVAPRPTPVKTEVLNTGQLRMPTKIPKKVEMVQESSAPPPSAVANGVVGGVPGGVAGGQIGGVIGGVLSSAPAAVPKVATPQKVRVSQGVVAGLLQHKVEPQYPPAARAARIQGAVVLKAIIGKDGRVDDLKVISGHPMLAQAALNAVRQWRYKPYYLNGQPVAIDTTITVNFTLAS